MHNNFSEISLEYGVLAIGDFAVADFENTTCCGLTEIFDFQQNNGTLDELCHVFANTGVLWQPPTVLTTLTLVHNWDNWFAIADALVLGGWQMVSGPSLNPNSSNHISLWVYNKEENE